MHVVSLYRPWLLQGSVWLSWISEAVTCNLTQHYLGLQKRHQAIMIIHKTDSSRHWTWTKQTWTKGITSISQEKCYHALLITVWCGNHHHCTSWLSNKVVDLIDYLPITKTLSHMYSTCSWTTYYILYVVRFLFLSNQVELHGTCHYHLHQQQVQE